jgi:Ca2+-binding EF-hand superfamily protein
MAFFFRSARTANGLFAAGAGAVAINKFQPHFWQHSQLIACEQDASPPVVESASRKASRIVSKTKSGKMSLKDSTITQDTALYKAYEAKFGARKGVQMTFSDVAQLFKGIGIKNQYLANSLFRAMDEDHSGTVSCNEMNYFCHTLAMGTRQEKAKFMFDSCDRDGDGTVEPSEMREMVKNLTMTCHEAMPEYVILKTEADIALCEDLEMNEIATLVSNRLCYQMFRDCDTKKKGSVTYKDFETWVVRNQGAAREWNELFVVFDRLLAKN